MAQALWPGQNMMGTTKRVAVHHNFKLRAHWSARCAPTHSRYTLRGLQPSHTPPELRIRTGSLEAEHIQKKSIIHTDHEDRLVTVLLFIVVEHKPYLFAHFWRMILPILTEP